MYSAVNTYERVYCYKYIYRFALLTEGQKRCTLILVLKGNSDSKKTVRWESDLGKVMYPFK
jgi:hypothetical protein